MHEGDIIFSANQGDSSIEDEDLQAKEIKEAYGEIEYSEDGCNGFTVTSPPGRLATSKLATKSHLVLLQ